MDVVQINGVHLAYRYRPGLRRTLVFANSLGSDQSLWDELVAALPRGYGVLTADLRGHGLSNGSANCIEAFADDVSQLIDHLGLEDVLFVGVSIGGMIGQVLAARRADVVSGAVLCNTACRIGTAARWSERIQSVEASGVAGIAGAIVANWFGPAYNARVDRLALHQSMVARTSNAGYLAACAAIRDADLSEYATAIGVPVLCVGGSADKSVPAEKVTELADLIPNARAEIIEGLGHLPSLEIPDVLARLVVEFEESLPTDDNLGMSVRRRVLGAKHVDRASSQVTPLDAAFQALITESAWGTVWASHGIAARERSMLTLALLAAAGNFDEIPMHVRATQRTGATLADIREAFQHVAIYAGVPRANHALKLAKQTLADMNGGNDE